MVGTKTMNSNVETVSFFERPSFYFLLHLSVGTALHCVTVEMIHLYVGCLKNGYVFNHEAHVEVLVVWVHSIIVHPKLRGDAHPGDMLPGAEQPYSGCLGKA